VYDQSSFIVPLHNEMTGSRPGFMLMPTRSKCTLFLELPMRASLIIERENIINAMVSNVFFMILFLCPCGLISLCVLL